jgi:hypothetical protein
MALSGEIDVNKLAVKQITFSARSVRRNALLAVLAIETYA